MEIQINPLTTGTIIKIYNSNRGQDYVVLGRSKKDHLLIMAKNSAITNDGKLFKQSKLYTLDMTAMFKASDPFYFVEKVKRVVGHRTLDDVKKEKLISLATGQTFYKNGEKSKLLSSLNTFEILKNKDEVYPPLDTPDIKKVISY